MKPLFVLLTALVVQAAEKPNIVVFLSDDHTWRDSSIYGSTEIETPHMARLAKDGHDVRSAFVNSPSCAPARAALLTGLYPANNGAEANHSRPRADIKKLPAYFQELGYEVVSFGKVGHYAQTPEYGFDLARHFGYHEDIAIPKAIEWLRQRQSEKPLCLFVGTNWPHVPWPEDSEFPPDELQVPPTHVDNPPPATGARYLAAVRIMDDELGMVYDAAREKLGENLFFLHTSDHGAQWPFGKWNLYEDGIRTPLIVSWPGKIQPAPHRAMVSWIDILPTLVEVAGGSQAPQDIDGRSFLPVLRGEKEHAPRRDLHHAQRRRRQQRLPRSARPHRRRLEVHPQPAPRVPLHQPRHQEPRRQRLLGQLAQSAVTDPEARERSSPTSNAPPRNSIAWRTTPGNFAISSTIPPTPNASPSSPNASIDWMEETGDPQQGLRHRPKRIAASGKAQHHHRVSSTTWAGRTSPASAATRSRPRTSTGSRPRASASRSSTSTRRSARRPASPDHGPVSAALAHHVLSQQPPDNTDRGMAQWLDPAARCSPASCKKRLRHRPFRQMAHGRPARCRRRPAITEYGFDRSLTNFEGMGAKLLPLTLTPGGKTGPHLAGRRSSRRPVTWMQRSEITGGFVEAAMEFIDRSRATVSRSSSTVWPDDVHSPFFPPLDRWGDGQASLYYGVLDDDGRAARPAVRPHPQRRPAARQHPDRVLFRQRPRTGAGRAIRCAARKPGCTKAASARR
jgi:hypothetical protein